METTPTQARRWDTDTRGTGVGDGARIAPEVEAALAALAEPGWVAEDPDAHLLPHLRRVCAESGSPWTLVGAALQDTVYVADLRWHRAEPSWSGLHADAFALIGAVAEPATFVRQRSTGDRVEYHVSTGVPAGDGPFKAHGHLLRLRVGGEQVERLLAGNRPDTPDAGGDRTS